MTKAEKIGRFIFGLLFLLTLLSYSAVNAWEAREELNKQWESFQIWDLKDDLPELDHVLEEQVFGRYKFVEAYGALQLLMGKNEENSFDNVKDKEGYLFGGDFWTGFGDDQKMLAERMRRLMDYMAEKDTKVGFVLCPEKTAREEACYRGIPYHSFEKLGDDLLSWLAYYNVPHLDLRKTIENTGLSYEETWYRTDHHWTPRAAFEGYKEVVNWMNAEFGAGLDPEGITRDIANYDQIYYPSTMLGSQGRDTGIIYAGGMEDFTAVIPKEPGNYQWSYSDTDRREGSFREAFLEEDLYGLDPYYVNADNYYLHSITSYSRQLNLDIENGERILLLRDSFASPVGAFLAQNFRQVDMLWSLQYSPEKLEEYLEEHSYDYIIVMLYPSNLSESGFPFFTERPELEETQLQ